jgi:hypothetical protein
LDNATCQEKREVLEMLDIKVTATPPVVFLEVSMTKDFKAKPDEE